MLGSGTRVARVIDVGRCIGATAELSYEIVLDPGELSRFRLVLGMLRVMMASLQLYEYHFDSETVSIDLVRKVHIHHPN